MAKLEDLPNIGPKLRAQLEKVGIHTPEELKAAGGREAWLRILGTDPSACMLRLQSLEGAARGVPKKELDATVKEELRALDVYKRQPWFPACWISPTATAERQ